MRGEKPVNEPDGPVFSRMRSEVDRCSNILFISFFKEEDAIDAIIVQFCHILSLCGSGNTVLNQEMLTMC